MERITVEEIRETAKRLYPKVREWRRDFHRYPELSGDEKRTAEIVAEQLKRLGLEVREEVGGYGVIGVLKGSFDGPVIGFRADMDALPIQEETGFPYSSTVPGVMHACGHDGHTAMLMGTAEVLVSFRDRLCGTVKFIFQPAEETGNGAKRMKEDGALDAPNVDILLGMHLLFHEAGTIAYKKGYALTASDTFELTVRGAGGHGAKPHETNDPLLTACSLVNALQYVVSRKVNPQQMATLTVGTISSGSAGNVIPGEAKITGTVRTLQKETQETMIRGIRETADGICRVMGCQYELNYHKNSEAVYNAPETMDQVLAGIRRILPENRIQELQDARCGSEDFSGFYRDGLQTAYIWLGGAYPGEKHPSTNHQPKYDWDERTMETGIQAAVASILEFLQEHN